MARPAGVRSIPGLKILSTDRDERRRIEEKASRTGRLDGSASNVHRAFAYLALRYPRTGPYGG
jgi:hypothetical protein